MKIMKTVKEALNAVELIDAKLNPALVKQFTIDLIEELIEELNCLLLGESNNSAENTLGNLSYKVGCAMEICDDELTDYYVLQELYDAVNYR